MGSQLLNSAEVDETCVLDGICCIGTTWSILNAQFIGSIEIRVGSIVVRTPSSYKGFSMLQEYQSVHEVRLVEVDDMYLDILFCCREKLYPKGKVLGEMATTWTKCLTEAVMNLDKTSVTRKDFTFMVGVKIRVNASDWITLGDLFKAKLIEKANDMYKSDSIGIFFILHKTGQNHEVSEVNPAYLNNVFHMLNTNRMMEIIVHVAHDAIAKGKDSHAVLRFTPNKTGNSDLHKLHFYSMLGLSEYGNIQSEISYFQKNGIPWFQIYSRWTNHIKNNPFMFFTDKSIAVDLSRLAQSFFEGNKFQTRRPYEIILNPDCRESPTSIVRHSVADLIEQDVTLRFEAVCQSRRVGSSVSDIILDSCQRSRAFFKSLLQRPNAELRVEIIKRHVLHTRAKELLIPFVSLLREGCNKVRLLQGKKLMDIPASSYWTPAHFKELLCAEVIVSFMLLGKSHFNFRPFNDIVKFFEFEKPNGTLGQNRIKFVAIKDGVATLQLDELKLPMTSFPSTSCTWFSDERFLALRNIRVEVEKLLANMPGFTLKPLAKAISIFCQVRKNPTPQVDFNNFKFNGERSVNSPAKKEVRTTRDFWSNLIKRTDPYYSDVSDVIREVGNICSSTISGADAMLCPILEYIYEQSEDEFCAYIVHFNSRDGKQLEQTALISFDMERVCSINVFRDTMLWLSNRTQTSLDQVKLHQINEIYRLMERRLKILDRNDFQGNFHKEILLSASALFEPEQVPYMLSEYKNQPLGTLAGELEKITRSGDHAKPT